MNTFVNISGYKFIALTNLANLQRSLKQHCQAIELKGTILISAEGININLAGTQQQIDKFQQYLAKNSDFEDITYKVSYSDFVPFKKMWVKIKKEIITFKNPNLNLEHNSEHCIKPKQLQQWLQENKDITLLDTRNDYESAIGSFKNAIKLDIQNFTDLPEHIEHLSEAQKQKPIVMFCTGGVRCEKVVPLFLEKGINHVYQLDGGILNYFAECGSDHYEGECFVFDDRVALDANLATTGTVLCKKCQWPVTKIQQQALEFKPEEACPHCFTTN